jgi:hypothetical protein
MEAPVVNYVVAKWHGPTVGDGCDIYSHSLGAAQLDDGGSLYGSMGVCSHMHRLRP